MTEIETMPTPDIIEVVLKRQRDQAVKDILAAQSEGRIKKTVVAPVQGAPAGTPAMSWYQLLIEERPDKDKAGYQ